LKWFKHDADAHRDAKLKRVIMKYGMEGYGLYWHCIELIAGSVDVNNITFELEHDAEIIAHDTGIHFERVQEMMTYMVNLGLFENDNGVITCMKLAKRLDQSMTSNPNFRQLINKIHDENGDSVKEQSRQGHDGVMTGSAQNRIEQNRKEKRVRFTPPTVNEVREYCRERSNDVDAQRFVDFYEAKGWYVGKNKMKDWKAAVRTWEKDRSESKPKRVVL